MNLMKFAQEFRKKEPNFRLSDTVNVSDKGFKVTVTCLIHGITMEMFFKEDVDEFIKDMHAHFVYHLKEEIEGLEVEKRIVEKLIKTYSNSN